MKRNVRKAFTALMKINAPVIDHGSPDQQWHAHFILSAELRDSDDTLFADYYQSEISEYVDAKGKVINAWGIRQDVIDILESNKLHSEWIDPGTVGIYDR